jgi:ABC-2 type transport system permease protein
MTPAVFAIRNGLSRGWIEFRQILARWDEQLFTVASAVVILVILYFQRTTTPAGTSVPLGNLALPGDLTWLLAFNTLSGAAFVIGTEREDGTLLRAKAAPYGVLGYFVGQVVRIPLTVLAVLVLILVPGLFLFPGVSLAGHGWVTLLWVTALGLLATLPWGMAIGGFGTSPRAASVWVFIVSLGLMAISGIFYPMSALADWLQSVAQVFPFYWIGLGMRSAFLPDTAAAAEISGSWRHLETLGVLGAWAAVGLILAPAMLRRMARHQSGASLEAGRQKRIQRS